MTEYRFIDLFSGIGGFHYALTKKEKPTIEKKTNKFIYENEDNFKCVLACDKDKECRKTYKNNFSIEPKEDIIKLDTKDIPDFNILCAGFPCQPFSNGGNKKSFKDDRGNLFDEIIRIAKDKKPDYMFLENVKHILKVDNGNVFKIILKKLKEINYKVNIQILSPHQLGIPQQRERVIFTCIRKKLYESKYKNKGIFKDNLTDESNDFDFELGLDSNVKIKEVFEKNPDKKYNVDTDTLKALNIWDEMIKKLEVKEKLSPTILCKEFKTSIDTEEFKKLVKWKQDYITKNKPIYLKYQKEWDSWYDSNKDFLNKKEVFCKLEWQVGPKKKDDSIWNHFIQIRQSGIRVKKSKYFPTLVAIVQTPIYGKKKRYITPRECARLQSFPDEFKLHEKDNIAYKQFGNAVNVQVIQRIVKLVLNHNI